MAMKYFSKGVLFLALAHTMLHMPGPPPDSLFGKISGATLMIACWLMGIGYIIASIPDKK